MLNAIKENFYNFLFCQFSFRFSDPAEEKTRQDFPKKRKLNFDEVFIVDELGIPESLVQITVDENEMQDRIKSFIELKRGEIDENNIRDFIEDRSGDSCARVLSNVYRIKDSKGHLRIKRIKNETGPIFDQSFHQSKIIEGFSGISERLENVEDFLSLDSKSLPKEIYQRLKLIEDQISHLKTISPEYSKFVTRKKPAAKNKIGYTVNELDKIISTMESTT